MPEILSKSMRTIQSSTSGTCSSKLRSNSKRLIKDSRKERTRRRRRTHKSLMPTRRRKSMKNKRDWLPSQMPGRHQSFTALRSMKRREHSQFSKTTSKTSPSNITSSTRKSFSRAHHSSKIKQSSSVTSSPSMCSLKILSRLETQSFLFHLNSKERTS